MDTEMLELVLKEEYTYQDVEKSLFLRNLEWVFGQFRNRGDGELLPFRGKCSSNVCGNFCMPGFSFTGNRSGCFMNLLIERESDTVKDICQCNRFRNPEGKLFAGEQLHLEMREDPMVIHLADYETEKAWREIVTGKDHLLYISDINYWLDKHQFLPESVKDNEMPCSNYYARAFMTLYDAFSLLPGSAEDSRTGEGSNGTIPQTYRCGRRACFRAGMADHV